MQGKCILKWLCNQTIIQQILVVILTNNHVQSSTGITNFAVSLEIIQTWRRSCTSDRSFGAFRRRFVCYGAQNSDTSNDKQVQKYNASNSAWIRLQMTFESWKYP